jgi:hypothetical protein
MIGKAPVTENVIYLLSDLADIIDFWAPKTRREWRERDLILAYRNNKRVKASKAREGKRVKRALANLERAEAITFDKKEGKYKLTPKGWLKFLQYYTKGQKKKKREKVGEYLIVFDIPEKHRRFRDLFRKCLFNLGFNPVQKSVFQTNKEDKFIFAQKIVANCGLERHVKFVEARRIL